MATVCVNGEQRAVEGEDPNRPLLWYLRDTLGLKGTKFGCGHGGCGACTVTIDGHAVPSCKTTIAEAAGKNVLTIEGLAKTTEHPIFKAWLAEQVPQCGYCQPGMVMATAALLADHPAPTNEQIESALDRVLCRCGSYQRVRKAVHRAAEQRWDDAPFPATPLPAAPRAVTGNVYRFNPWVSIAEDNTVLVTIERSEMGQGVTTALAMLVAEELDVSLDQIDTVAAPVDKAYENPLIGMQITVGSMSVKNAWHRVRHAGAEARARLIAAAALRWNVAPGDCYTVSGSVCHDLSGCKVHYGELAAAASAMPPITNPVLKDPQAFHLLGTPTARLEVPGHVAGRTIFGMDVSLPGLLFATLLLPPVPTATVRKIDDERAKAIPGVRGVVQISDGVAVVGDDLWSAFRGRDALEVTWDSAPSALSTEDVFGRLRSALDRPGIVERAIGDFEAVFERASSRLEAVYETPYAAHVPIEPINCTARVSGNGCDVWVPTQAQTIAQAAAAQASGLPLDAVRVHTTFLGGGFGRRSSPDVVNQTVQIAKQVGAPVQVAWTRSDDVQHDKFRPASAIRLRAALNEARDPVGLLLHIAGPQLAFDGIDIPYAIPNVRVECTNEDPGLPTHYWRSVGASQNAFAIEGFIDELAYARIRDPVDFRLGLLQSSPRYRAVLELAAEKADWSNAPEGRAQGVALYYTHGGWAAQISEISIDAVGSIVVHRVICAVDCGFVVNPDTVKAQIEGGIAFGLTAALKEEITIDRGQVVQTGFRDYPILTIGDMPEVEVHIVASREDPSGVGECAVPPIAPSVANAVCAATGRRLRRLPLRL